MTITIFGTSQSRAFRVLWAATELGISFEHKPLSWETCGSDPDYLAMNPAGSVPCLLDGDFVLSESLAINIYLAQKQQGLWPSAQRDQALSQQWSFWAATSLEEPYVRWALHEHWLPRDIRNAQISTAALRDLERPLKRLDLALSKTGWLIGSQFTIADLNVAAVMNLMNGTAVSAWPAVSEWLHSCVGRPAYRKAAQLP